MSTDNNSTTSSSNDFSIHSNILREFNKEDPFKKYQIIEVIGEGSMGAVFKVRIRKDRVGGSAFHPKRKGLLRLFRVNRGDSPLRHSNHSVDFVFALKRIMLDRISQTYMDEFRNEISILRNLDHPNIVRPHEVYSSPKQIYLVLELCDGGDLYTRSPYTERQAGSIVASVLRAVLYMHEHGVVHRDLKFENIMFANTNPDAIVKIIDFGLSKKFLGKPGQMTERVGTMYTMAPQVLQGMYSCKADVWSIGVITFMLLSSMKPFNHKRRRVMIDLIMRAAYNFEAPTWDIISDSAKDFVSKLIVIDPDERLDAEQALSHPWIVDLEHLPDYLPSEESLAKIDDSLVNYRHTSQLKKLALTLIAHRSTTEEMVELRKVFQAYDTDKRGVISYEEFRAALKDLNYSDETLSEIFESIDLNHNGCIMWTEFLAATIETHGFIEEDYIAEAFDRLDGDGSGYITPQKLQAFLGQDCTPEQVQEIMKSADLDEDGRISYKEFLTAFRSTINTATKTIVEEGSNQYSDHSSDDNLLGLDAQIPGGRSYSENSAENQFLLLNNQQIKERSLRSNR